MKNKIPIHIILCGLLSSTIMASERNTNSNMHQANTSQSRNSPQSSSPITISKTIPIKKRRNSSLSPSCSPQFNQALSPKNSFSEHSISPSLSSNGIDDYSILVNKFFVESKGKYHLIDKDGTLNKDSYITDEDKTRYLNHYEAQLIIKNNEPSIKTTRLISLGFKPIEHQSSVQTNLTNTQIKELQKLSPDKKIIASDDLHNLYYILACVSNSADNSEQS